MGREIIPDEDFSSLEIGRTIHDIFYKDFRKEVSFEGIKLDFIKKEEKIVCEVKTSSKFLEATKFQVAYYLYRLKEYGISTSGEVLVPQERKKIRIVLDKELEKKLLESLKEIGKIIELEKPPAPVRIPFCRRCAYREMCWV
jgi:CRISPR-associated exonuclease Cas4